MEPLRDDSDTEPAHGICPHCAGIGLLFYSGNVKLTSVQFAPSMTVFDLPQLYTKPSAIVILQALERLAIQPRTFSRGDKALVQRGIRSSGVSQYLTSIIASALAWLDSDELREEVWEAASARLCERSGRSGKLSHPNLYSFFWWLGHRMLRSAIAQLCPLSLVYSRYP